MKNKLIKISLLLLFAMCNKEREQKICGVDQPGTDLEWIRDLINDNSNCKMYEGAKLYTYQFNNDQVVYLSNPASSLAICNEAVYNCTGVPISSNWTQTNWQNFESKRSNEKLIWQKN